MHRNVPSLAHPTLTGSGTTRSERTAEPALGSSMLGAARGPHRDDAEVSMISLELALRLRTAGLAWQPASGDRFVLPGRDMDEDVFVLSDMTVDLQDVAAGRVIGFNGTTEWALDSVQQEEALWLPAEDQLRELVGLAFRRLERDEAGDGFVLRVRTAGGDAAFRADDPADAYARALLDLLDGAGG